MPRRLLVLLIVAAHILFQFQYSYDFIARDHTGRDFASYYYGVQTAADGKDPYKTENLNQLSRVGERKTKVHPYFYPPPYLVAVSWALPMSLKTATWVMLAINELLLVACISIMVAGFGAPLWAVLLMAMTFTPIADNGWMGQANLMALCPTLLGLYLSRKPGKTEILGGALVGLAGMLKMSPAFFLVHLGVERRFRAVAAAVGTAIASSLLALPVVGLGYQLRFYTEVLPGFGSGDYNGLNVPITLNANHSWPDLLNRMFPGNGDKLSSTAQLLSTVSLIAVLVGFGLWSSRVKSADPRTEALKFSALSILLVILPVYTYEHHFVALIPALLMVAGEVGRDWKARPLQKLWFAATWFCVSWPLEWLRAAQKAAPMLDPLFRESKFIGAVSLCIACIILARSSAPRSDPGRSEPGHARG